ncbi:MAG: hypothetical protein HQL33_05635 [Alphaproteobacteria bacterium]|nr:hypothetical protein [Alphaproteobacteria bacterium]MBF0129451.1 hypothetical protein [Alphaproteobacteria bacterium]
MRRIHSQVLVAVVVLATAGAAALLSGNAVFRGPSDGVGGGTGGAPRPADLPQPPDTEVLWLAGDNQIRRAAVDTARHARFITAVTASIAQDRQRLAATLKPRLRAELDAVLVPMEARAPALAEDVFSLGASYELVMGNLAGGDETRPLESRVRESLDAYLRDAYRDKVVQPQMMMPRVRAAVAVAFADTRRDLLHNCDKYDLAFQDFLSREARRVEMLSAGAGWTVDEAWTSANASYRSLCHAARLADILAGVVDPGSYDELSMGAPAMSAMAGRLAATLSANLLEPHATAREVTQVLSDLGLPRAWSSLPATLLASVRRSPELYGAITAKFDEAANRADFVAATRLSVKDARARFEARIETAFHRFIDLELEAISARLSIPMDGDGETGSTVESLSGQSLKNHSTKDVAQTRLP